MLKGISNLVIKVEDKVLGKITSWDEIYNLSGYTDSLDPSREELKQVITKYELPIKGRCGLPNCRTPHNKGYIVKTITGRLTNLGHICGRNHFGSTFTTLKNQLNREIEYKNKIEILNNAKSNISHYYHELKSLENNWNKLEDVYRVIQIEELNEISTVLNQMVASKNPEIISQRKANDFERELEEVRTGKAIKDPYFIDENIGELRGIIYLTNRVRVEAILRNNRTIIKKISEFNIDEKSFKEVKAMTQEYNHLEDSIRNLNMIINDGFTLFKRSNIEQLNLYISSKRRRKFKRLLNRCFE